MAELKVQVQVVKDTALKDIQSLEQRLAALEKDPVQIKFQVSGVDGAAQQTERLANAQNRVASAASSAAASSASFASSQRSSSSAISGATQRVNSLESAYSRLGVTVANFAKYKLFEAVTSGVRNSITEMRNLDDELVTVRKVAGATEAELARIERRSYEVGNRYGKAPSDYASSVAAFSRAGYRETADALAELSIKAQLVGDINADTANQFLLATDAAYGYAGSVEQLSVVLDGMNAIDNTFATSIEKISAGLGKIAPIAAMAHVGIDELVAALGTITAVTQRSGEEAATALRALFLNIMGDTRTEIEDGATWTAGEIEGLRDIMREYIPEIVAEAERMGTVINPMEAIGALAQAYEDGLINEERLMQQVSDIGGKLRSSQLLAIIQNWDMYESMLSTYRNAFGSADAEIDGMMDSWSMKAQQLSTSFTKLMSGLFNSSMAKDGLDVLRAIVEALDTDLGRATISAVAFGAAAAGIATAATKAAAAIGGLVSGATKFGAANWIGVAVAGITLLIGLYDALTVSQEELIMQSEEAAAEYEREKNNLDAIEAQIEANKQQMAEIQSMGPITYVEAQQLADLREATVELEAQKKLQQEITAAKQHEAAVVAANVMETLLHGDEGEKNRLLKYGVSFDEAAELAAQNTLPSLIKQYKELNTLTEDGNTLSQDQISLQEQLRDQAALAAGQIDNELRVMQAYYDNAMATPQHRRTPDQLRVIRQYEAGTAALKEYYKTFDYYGTYVERWGTQTDKARAVGERYVASLIQAHGKYITLADSTGIAADEQAQYNELASASANELAAYNRAVTDVTEKVNSLTNAEEALNLAQSYGLNEEGTFALYNHILGITGIAENLSDIELSPSTPSEATTSAYAKLNEAIEQTTNQYLLLKKAQEELNDTGFVSAETFQRIREEGIELGEVFQDEVTGNFKVASGAIEDSLGEMETWLTDFANVDFEIDTSGVDAFTQALREAQNELANFQNYLRDNGEEGDLFRDYQAGYEAMIGLWDEGALGTKEFSGWARMLFNDRVISDARGQASKLGAMLGDDFTQGLLGGDMTRQDVAQALYDRYGDLPVNETGLWFQTTADGLTINIDNFEKFSEATGFSIELLQALAGWLSEGEDKLYEFSDASDNALEGFEGIVALSSKQGANGKKIVDFDDFIGNAAKAGKSADEIADAVEQLKTLADAGEIEFEIPEGTDVAAEIQNAVDLAEELGQPHDAEINVTGNATEQLEEISSLVGSIEGNHDVQFTIKVSGGAGGLGSQGGLLAGLHKPYIGASASGTSDAEAGPTLVNELGPELIVSKGRAFVAGGGRPTIVNLDSGDIVYNHLETEQLLNGRSVGEDGIASKASGTGQPKKSVTVSMKDLGDFTKDKKTTKKQSSSGKNSSGSSSSGGGSTKETDWWSVVDDHFGYLTDKQQLAIDRLKYQVELLENDLEDLTKPLEKEVDLLSKLNDQIDRQIELLKRQQEALVEPLQDEIDALQKAKEIQDEQLELEERKKAVEEARAELQNAQNERNIRYFNAEKGQWEWMADQGRIADAQEALEDAEKSLEDYEYEMHIRELEKQIEQIEDVYNAKVEELEDTQVVNEDKIYDLEQKIAAAEEAYNAIIDPLEEQVTKLERELADLEHKWAEAAYPYERPEESLGKALPNLGGTAAEKQAVKELLDKALLVAQGNYETIQHPTTKPVTVSPTQTTAAAYNDLLAQMGLMFGASYGTELVSGGFTTSSATTQNDYSGSVYIGEIRVEGNPNDITLAQLVEDVGIYVQR